jgi:putative colanic acid biosynthesis acetyltransferase WcaF
MNLAEFDNSGFNRGAGGIKELLWIVTRTVGFSWLVPFRAYAFRRALLRIFGGEIGRGVIFKPEAKVTFPWKLSVGANSWIGEEAWVLNLDRITIGHDTCISQRALLCTGSHDWSDERFPLITKPITIGNGVWICANVFVGPGVHVGDDAVVLAGSVVTSDLPAGMVCSGNPCKPIKPRTMRERPVKSGA